jgi:hypothetical protein
VNPTEPTARETAVVHDETTADFFNGIDPKQTSSVHQNSALTVLAVDDQK